MLTRVMLLALNPCYGVTCCHIFSPLIKVSNRTYYIVGERLWCWQTRPDQTRPDQTTGSIRVLHSLLCLVYLLFAVQTQYFYFPLLPREQFLLSDENSSISFSRQNYPHIWGKGGGRKMSSNILFSFSFHGVWDCCEPPQVSNKTTLGHTVSNILWVTGWPCIWQLQC